jgi:hypothetical protein
VLVVVVVLGLAGGEAIEHDDDKEAADFSLPSSWSDSFIRRFCAAMSPAYYQPQKQVYRVTSSERLCREKKECRLEISRTSLRGPVSIRGEPVPRKACGPFHLGSACTSKYLL